MRLCVHHLVALRAAESLSSSLQIWFVHEPYLFVDKPDYLNRDADYSNRDEKSTVTLRRGILERRRRSRQILRPLYLRCLLQS